MNYEKKQQQLYPLLKPFSAMYSGIMQVRAAAYKHKVLRSQKSKNFCVAVGNISWGGSGKTPLTLWLLNWAEQNSLLPAVLTRGYGGKTEERPLLVKTSTNANESGDEPLMLARKFPASYIIADPVRTRALDWLTAHTKANFVILDDAMQHLAVQRDLNFVLLKDTDLTENWGKVIPAGPWRENASALQRASAFMLRADEKQFEKIKTLAAQKLAPFKKPVFAFTLKPEGLAPLGPEAEKKYGQVMLSTLNNQAYALCTAVGTPKSVRQSAASLLGYEPEQEFVYPDHYKFTAEDLKKIAKTELPVVVTAKDAVKLLPLLHNCKQEYFVLESSVQFGPVMFCDSTFEEWFKAQYKELA
ncbi:tetraacyldisaccharide 4'-kinase [Desulfovibrio sp. OttesenSCG-928-F07]|nr:tetraacyldisaccharide 4'-kinase [Desulfovibrio sp. OttesenSCG-928-F07]